MKKLIILNKKEANSILRKLKEQFKIKKLDPDYAFLKSQDNRIFITTKDLAKFDTKKARINSIGMYFGKIEKNGIRLSIEGSQLIGKSAKQVVNLKEKQSQEWLRGEDVKIDKKYKGFVIVKHKNDFLGSGLFKENKILNFVPKERRVT